MPLPSNLFAKENPSMRALLAFLLLPVLSLTFSTVAGATSPSPVRVFVSVLPLKYFVERVGGEGVEVSVMVGPGRSPATYEPTPRQMAELSRTQVYYRVGVPFEQVWMQRVAELNPKLRIVDLREGIHLRTLPAHHHEDMEEHHGPVDHDHPEAASEEKDPHIWTDPRQVKNMAEQIRQTLTALDPSRGDAFAANCRVFAADLDRLDRFIRDRLAGARQRKFLVFHPAWGYFADAYGLEQVAVEAEGKEPGPQALARIIDQAREEKIRIIFVQQQFSQTTARTVARAIGALVVAVDPLAEDYVANMRLVAGSFARSLE
jgi:zinc transport system substrate-binding protein